MANYGKRHSGYYARPSKKTREPREPCLPTITNLYSPSTLRLLSVYSPFTLPMEAQVSGKYVKYCIGLSRRAGAPTDPTPTMRRSFCSERGLLR
ncbi:MAG: hypothetical protein FRX48_00704 [Lasallia pustulata]|uniref:Uncharacterized protein n=1 Tax=Lasallia pustulata TaxID=136370 RepID=A0A5M8Q450_9LECA|nr:MAG: hypothetical protein FRX48_00704 [Lasallia pustulata]